MPSDSLLPSKQESGVVDLGGMRPPSPHTCMSQLWLQYPRSSKFIDPWSNTVATWLWLTLSAGMMRCVSLGRIAKQKLPREEGSDLHDQGHRCGYSEHNDMSTERVVKNNDGLFKNLEHHLDLYCFDKTTGGNVWFGFAGRQVEETTIFDIFFIPRAANLWWFCLLIPGYQCHPEVKELKCSRS